MKIYIINLLPQSIKNKWNKLINSLGYPEEKIIFEIFSKEFGKYIIEEEQIYHLETTFINSYETVRYYNNLDLLVDKTDYKYIPVVSQLPTKYISKRLINLTFKLSKKSKLSLIIECLEETVDFEKQLVPIHFYFDYNDDKLDLKDPFFQEDFNMFLSQLN
jgi:hypothetical protein